MIFDVPPAIEHVVKVPDIQKVVSISEGKILFELCGKKNKRSRSWRRR